MLRSLLLPKKHEAEELLQKVEDLDKKVQQIDKKICLESETLDSLRAKNGLAPLPAPDVGRLEYDLIERGLSAKTWQNLKDKTLSKERQEVVAKEAEETLKTIKPRRVIDVLRDVRGTWTYKSSGRKTRGWYHDSGLYVLHIGTLMGFNLWHEKSGYIGSRATIDELLVLICWWLEQPENCECFQSANAHLSSCHYSRSVVY